MNKFLSLIITFLTFLFISCTATSKDVYSYYGNTVYKTDSAGNGIWAKSMNGYADPASPDSNVVTGVAFDGVRVYVEVFQAPVYTGLPPFNNRYYTTYVVMDTSGNILAVKGHSITPPEDYRERGFFPSIRSGVFRFSMSLSAGDHLLLFSKINSGGNVVTINGPLFYFEGGNRDCYLINFIALRDSNYLILTYTDPSPPSLGRGFCTLTKIRENGSIIFCHSFYQTVVATDVFPNSVVEDRIGNIYVSGTFDGYNNGILIYSGTYLNKLNPDGSTAIAKNWFTNNFPVSHNLQMINDSIYDFLGSDSLGNTRTMYIDSNLNGVCMPQSDSIIFQNDTEIPMISSPPLVTSPLSFNPTSAAPLSFPFTPSTLINYCLPLKNDENEFENDLSIYPNPTKNLLYITSGMEEKISKIEISTISGKILFSKTVNDFYHTEINIPELTSGIYFVSLFNGNSKITKKLIVQ